MKPDEGWSAAAREKASRYYRETLTSRLDSKLHGVIILVMQRLHADDLAGYLLRERPGKWVHLNLPAIAPEDRTIELGGDRTYFWKEGGRHLLRKTALPRPGPGLSVVGYGFVRGFIGLLLGLHDLATHREPAFPD
jgi:hypothetical protein